MLTINSNLTTLWTPGEESFQELENPTTGSANESAVEMLWGKDSSATWIPRALLQHWTLSRHAHTHTRIGTNTHTRNGKVKSECLLYTGSGRRRLEERVRSDGRESTSDVASPETRSCFHRP
jgi:hypothetical protein